MKTKITPFVKWVDGKSQLIGKLKAKMPKEYNTYYESFIGGGALFFDVMPKKAVINDINNNLLNVYQQLQKSSSKIISVLLDMDSVKCDKTHFYVMRERFNSKIANKEYDIEFATLFIWINKHCFNGIYRENTKGLFNVPYNNKETGNFFDENNIKVASRFLVTCDLGK